MALHIPCDSCPILDACRSESPLIDRLKCYNWTSLFTCECVALKMGHIRNWNGVRRGPGFFVPCSSSALNTIWMCTITGDSVKSMDFWRLIRMLGRMQFTVVYWKLAFVFGPFEYASSNKAMCRHAFMIPDGIAHAIAWGRFMSFALLLLSICIWRICMHMTSAFIIAIAIFIWPVMAWACFEPANSARVAVWKIDPNLSHCAAIDVVFVSGTTICTDFDGSSVVQATGMRYGVCRLRRQSDGNHRKLPMRTNIIVNRLKTMKSNYCAKFYVVFCRRPHRPHPSPLFQSLFSSVPASIALIPWPAC